MNFQNLKLGLVPLSLGTNDDWNCRFWDLKIKFMMKSNPRDLGAIQSSLSDVNWLVAQ